MQGRIVQTSPGSVPRQKRFLDEMPGILAGAGGVAWAVVPLSPQWERLGEGNPDRPHAPWYHRSIRRNRQGGSLDPAAAGAIPDVEEFEPERWETAVEDFAQIVASLSSMGIDIMLR